MAKTEDKAKMGKREDTLKALAMSAVMFAGGSLFGMVTTGAMGVSALAVSGQNAEDLKNKVILTDEFDISLADAKREILHEYKDGKISQAEFESKIVGLYTYENAVAYAKQSGDPELEKLAEEYEHNVELSDNALHEGFPLMASFTAAGLVGATAAELARRKCAKKLKSMEDEDSMEM